MTAKSLVGKDQGATDQMQKHEGTISERFTLAVSKEFGNLAGSVSLTPYQKRLAQHLFIKIDASLNELEKKRTDQAKPAIAWPNVNMTKLAVDAMHRIELGLDALIPNHISIIPYLNGRTKKYDLDLRVGYVGKDLYRRSMAIDPPIDVRYELVYETDVFEPIKKSVGQDIEQYKFQINNPFKRGAIIGGFAYLEFEDSRKNQLVIVTDEDFKKSEAKAQSKEFWSGHPAEMKYKTLVTRATSKLQIDPEKVNASFAAVEKDDVADEASARAEIEGHANTGEVLVIEADPEDAPKEQIQDPSGVISCPDTNGMVIVAACNACAKREGCPSHEGTPVENKQMSRKPRF